MGRANPGTLPPPLSRPVGAATSPPRTVATALAGPRPATCKRPTVKARVDATYPSGVRPAQPLALRLATPPPRSHASPTAVQLMSAPITIMCCVPSLNGSTERISGGHRSVGGAATLLICAWFAGQGVRFVDSMNGGRGRGERGRGQWEWCARGRSALSRSATLGCPGPAT
jgi:hypothetical protein